MRTPITFVAAVLFGAAVAAAPADASCKRFGFTVNDYGKDGPTKDAKELLDKHISEWATQQGIKDYKTGPKSVNCELFLNFVVFDEHTCTASANVCWNDGKGKSTPETAAISPEDGEAVPPTPIRKAALLGHDKKAMAAAATPPAAPEGPGSPQVEESATPPATPAVATTETTTPAATPPPPPAEPAKAAEAAPTPPPAIETGTLPKDPLSALKKHAAADPAPASPPPSVTAPKNDPAAASAAATAAAAAAERAAVAAETAANAAKEAAAAAVAASAASKGSVVPAGDGTP